MFEGYVRVEILRSKALSTGKIECTLLIEIASEPWGNESQATGKILQNEN